MVASFTSGFGPNRPAAMPAKRSLLGGKLTYHRHRIRAEIGPSLDVGERANFDFPVHALNFAPSVRRAAAILTLMPGKYSII